MYKRATRILAITIAFTVGVSVGIWIGGDLKDRAWRAAIEQLTGRR